MRNKGRLILIMVICFSWSLSAQKTISKSYDAPSLKEVNINGEGFFNIETGTHSKKKIEIQARFEGEYCNKNIIQVERTEKSLVLALDWNPAFIKPDDKLAAHKLNAS